jgi:hydroxymethylbilane synthase
MKPDGGSPRVSGRVLRIGTRGSELALWQARHVAEGLGRLPGAPAVELLVIRTAGDRVADLPLTRVAGKAFFTGEIEDALSKGDIDLAVHSLKDLAVAGPPGLVIGAVLARDDPRDVLILRRDLASAAPAGSGLDALPAGARVGTCSLRRRALLARWRADLGLVDLRGNVPTRVQKLDGGQYEAIVLAAAGVRRLGLEERISAFLPPERVLPAPGQGAIAVQVREGDGETRAWIEKLDDPAARAATTAERAFLARLEGGCQVPVGALAEWRSSRLSLAGVVCSLDGRKAIEGRVEAEMGAGEEGRRKAERLGEGLADDLLRRGAGEVLAGIRELPGEGA